MEAEMREAEVAARETAVAKREQALAHEMLVLKQQLSDLRVQLASARDAGDVLARDLRALRAKYAAVEAKLGDAQRELAKAKAEKKGTNQ